MGHSHPRPCRAHSQVPTLRPGDSWQCSPMPTFCQEQKLSVSERLGPPSPLPPAPTFDSPSGSYLALDLTLLSGGELFRGAGCVRCPQCLATSMTHPPPSSAGGPTHSPRSPQMPFKPLGGAPTGSGSPPAPAPRALCTKHLLRAWPWAELMHSLSFPPNPVRQGKRPPISQMSRLRLREAMCLVPSLAATKCQSPK